MEPLGVDLMKDGQGKLSSIKVDLLGSRSRQNKYADHKVRDMEFQAGENVLLPVSPMNVVMRFGTMGKSIMRYIGLFEVL